MKENERESRERRREVEEMKEKLLRLQEQNREFEREVEELNTQLTISLQAREALHKSRMTRTKYRREEGEGEEFSEGEDEIDEIMNEIAED